MSLAIRMWLVFAVYWFGFRIAEYIFEWQHNAAFNAALSIMAALIVFVREWESKNS